MALHKKISITALYASILASGLFALHKGTHTAVKESQQQNGISMVTLNNIKVEVPYFCYNNTFAFVDGSIDDPFVKGLSSLTATDGVPLFTCEEVFAFRDFGGDLQYAQELASLTDAEGKRSFTGKDIVTFKKAGGTTEYAKKFLSYKDEIGKIPFHGSQLSQFFRLGLGLEQVVTFTDTSKPNALLVYPTSDHPKNDDGTYDNDNFYVGNFRNDYSIMLFKKISNGYDVKVVAASQEEEVYTAICSGIPFQLLVISGHGSRESLSLGDNDPRLKKAEKDEMYSIDVNDTEMEQHLRCLDPKAVIFLNSCSTAEGGADARNLANEMAAWAKGRTVIAALDELYTEQIKKVKMDTSGLFDVTLLDKEGKRDITYRVPRK